MVKKQEDWANFGQLTNAANKRKYLDLCKDWLVSNEIVPTTSVHFYNVNNTFDIKNDSTIGMYDTEVRYVERVDCQLCSNELNLKLNGKVVVANPFSRAQFMIVCENCGSDINK